MRGFNLTYHQTILADDRSKHPEPTNKVKTRNLNMSTATNKKPRRIGRAFEFSFKA
ncbi:hypothetical protein THF1C08_70266 [Vibrio jasicida]|uniref:Uncharacterized protein n=1 Tax=Vibrio jasicida TaxID=766224 RepID=A0AAU9QWC0_9VIBR|nr:hypothetical protein THF1C08_70266 [Vibrio jasicida]CAH1602861.1 hypothetical protein THF1A12_60268 [Vibrio jasicida]